MRGLDAKNPLREARFLGVRAASGPRVANWEAIWSVSQNSGRKSLLLVLLLLVIGLVIATATASACAWEASATASVRICLSIECFRSP